MTLNRGNRLLKILWGHVEKYLILEAVAVFTGEGMRKETHTVAIVSFLFYAVWIILLKKTPAGGGGVNGPRPLN